MIKKMTLMLIISIQYNIEAQKTTFEIADSLYALGKYTKAIEAYKASKDLAIAYPKIAKSYIAIGNLDQAKTFYKKSIEFNPNDMLIKYDYAVILGKTKAIKEATEVFNELIEKDNTNPNYYYQLGLIKEKSRDTLALEQFLLAYKYDNTHQKTIFKIAKHYLKKRNHKLSHKYIDKGLETYAHNLSLMSLKAQNFYYQEYYDSAVVWFKKLIELGEESEFIHEKLSLSYAQNSDYNEAIEHAQKALRYSPNNSRTLYLIGTYYERLQKIDKAIEYIEKSLKIEDVPLSREYRKLGGLYNKKKDHKKALKILQKALKEDPTDIYTEFHILTTKFLYYEDKDEVIKLYEAFKEKHKDSPLARYAEMQITKLKEEKFYKAN